MDRFREVMASQSHLTGWSPVAIDTCNYVLGITFGSIFFPANFRWYTTWLVFYLAAYSLALYQADARSLEVTYSWAIALPVTVIIAYTSWTVEQKARQNFELSKSIEAEKIRSEEMLYSILPEEVADRLRMGQVIADPFSDTTVVFVDIAGSSALARDLSPKHFLQTLNDVFSIADEATILFGVEKVKTIGDAYLAVSGGRSGGDALSAVNFAIHVVGHVNMLASERSLKLGVRIGIHTGPVVGGVIGQKRATYDYWGDTMNVASRIESAAVEGGIAVSTQTYYATRHAIQYLPPRSAVLKGIGSVEVYDAVF